MLMDGAPVVRPAKLGRHLVGRLAGSVHAPDRLMGGKAMPGLKETACSCCSLRPRSHPTCAGTVMRATVT